MATEPLTGSRIPDSSFAPNIPQDISNAVRDLADDTVPRYANASARDAAFASWVALGKTIQEGQLSFTQNDKRYWRYTNTSVSGWSWVYAGGAASPIVTMGAGAGWSTVAGSSPGCFFDGDGMVNLVGAVSPNTTYNPQDGLTHTAAQLPSGYYPARATTCQINLGRVYVTGSISTGGLLSIIDGTTASVSATSLHILDGIRFHPGYTGSLPYN